MSSVSAPCRILLVEQNYVLRRTVATVARDLGIAQVHEASSAEAASSLMLARPFDGLVLDIDIGSLATELLARLRQGEFMAHAETPVIGMTSQTADAVESRIEEHLLFRLIHKPFKVRELLRKIEQVTRSRYE